MKNLEPFFSSRPKQQKVSYQQLLESYNHHKNIWKVGEELGICGQSVWERLKKYGLLIPKNYFTEEENKKIIEAYSNNFTGGDGVTNYLMEQLKRDRHAICRQARKLGLTNRNRKSSQKLKDKISENSSNWFKQNPHPKGMLGKKHSKEYCEQISIRTKKWYKEATPEMLQIKNIKTIQTRIKKYGSPAFPIENPKVTWKQGWRIIGKEKKYYRSRWEANYARYLQWQLEQGLIKDWAHEPQTFWFKEVKRGSITYLPDFKVENLDGSHLWIEVKGWMCSRSKTKIKRFRKYYPQEQLKIIDGKWFSSCAKKISILIPDWE